VTPTRAGSTASAWHLMRSGKRRPLPLETTIVYGPIVSRRFGRSLGVNLLPTTYKLCSFDCVYCHYGATDVKTVAPEAIAAREADFPSVGEIARELEAVLRLHRGVEAITFSGNGEPTLHPYFPEVAFEVHRLRDRIYPDARIALFSNATTLNRPEIRAALQHVDLPILKLDAGDAVTFARIDRPAPGIHFADVVAGLTQVPAPIVQTVLVDGPATNAGGAAFERWLETLATIRPRAVQIYSTDYPVPDGTVERVPPYRLRHLAEVAEHRIGAPVQAYWPG